MTRYELTERIGVGAMAEIFRGKAIADGGFEKPVAIKRILPHLGEDERFVKLLIAEANVMSHLRHRNIVQVFDVGQGPDGQYFVVLEFVDGTDLAALQNGLEAEGKRLPVDLGLYITAEICDALEHAHRAPGPDGEPLRLVHRDVAPTNVLLSRSGEVKLTDFGIAKRVEEETSHGMVRGKFAYISPEQAWSRPVDARSDVYSVGILLFELILGKRLFSRMGDLDALQAVRDGKVPRPRSVDPGLDPRLENILRKALAHDPAQRFDSAGELGKQLRSFRYSLPSSGNDPAAELGNAIDYYGPKGRARRAQASQEDDDFLSSTGSFTLTGRESLVGKQSYAEARQALEDGGHTTEDGEPVTPPGDEGPARETVLGLGLASLDEEADALRDEVTRVISDPFLTAPPPPPRVPGRVAAAAGVEDDDEDDAPPPDRQQARDAAIPRDAPIPAPPETIRGAQPILDFEPAAFPPGPALAMAPPLPASAMARPQAGPAAASGQGRPYRIMHTAAVAVPRRSRPRFGRVLVILLCLGGVIAGVAVYGDALLEHAGGALPFGAGQPDAAPPDAMAPDAAPPDAAPPDAAPPDAMVPDAMIPDAALPDAAPPGAMVPAADTARTDSPPAQPRPRKKRRRRGRR